MDSIGDVISKAESFLKEGDGQSGYDLPPEVEVIDTPAESTEVAIADEILKAVNELESNLRNWTGGRGTRSQQPGFQSKISTIRAAAAKLRNMHIAPV